MMIFFCSLLVLVSNAIPKLTYQSSRFDIVLEINLLVFAQTCLELSPLDAFCLSDAANINDTLDYRHHWVYHHYLPVIMAI